MVEKFLEHYLIYSALLMNFCWVYFTAIMRLQEILASGSLTPANKVLWYLSWVNLVAGCVLDTAVNWLVCTVLFLEFPHEFLTSSRLCRWYESTSTSWFDVKWRKPLAAWFGNTLLNNIDPSGRHVK